MNGFVQRQVSRVLLILLASCAGLGELTAGEEWPQFRGPRGDGHAVHAQLPLTWSETENITWKVPVEGEGYSSPVISGNQLWLTTAIVEPLSEEEEEAKLATLTTNPRGIRFGGPLTLRALAFDIVSGQLLHDVTCFQYPSANPKHATNSYASPTPLIAEGKVYCHFGEYGTCCIDAASGKIDWKNQEFKIEHQNGPGSSPVLWKNCLIVHYDGMDQQFIAAYERNSGQVLWKTDRSGEMRERGEMKKAYCTPTLTSVNGRDVLISPAADWVYGYDPASGKELWRASYGQSGFSTVPKPVVGHGLAFVCTSFSKSRLVAVKFDGEGDVSDSHVVWHSDRQIPQKPSLMLVGQELYFTSDGGIATCLDALTGEQNWQERFRGQYSASPLYASDRIYFFNHEGQTTVIRPGKSYELLAENLLDAGCMASPAVSGNALFLRTPSHLYRIESQP